jgi:hypothetical protein
MMDDDAPSVTTRAAKRAGAGIDVPSRLSPHATGKRKKQEIYLRDRNDSYSVTSISL